MCKKGSVFKKLIFSYISIILCILTAVTIYLTSNQMKQLKMVIDSDIRDLSMNLSINPLIVESFDNGQISNEVKEYLDELKEKLEYIDYIVLADTDSIRIYHPSVEQIGNRFQGDDEGPALEGAKPYITEGIGTMELQRRAFSTVYNENGDILGFVMVSAAVNSILLLQQQELMKYLIIFAMALFFGIILIAIFSKNLYKNLLGFEPKQLSQMFLQREDILGTLSEGLLLVNEEGKCEYQNPSAERLLNTVGKSEQEELIRSFIEKYIQPRQSLDSPIMREPVRQGGKYLLMDLIPVYEHDKSNKTLAILNDMSENMKLAEELTGVMHILKALRATIHENRNKMHVILGLLKTKSIEEAISFISDSVSEDDDNLIITGAIRDKIVAALIIGKKRRAKELNISFNLLKGSRLEEDNPYLPSLDMVTIIGNLIENSYEAVNVQANTREVSLYLNSSKEGLSIIVDDTGIGMDEETVDKIQRENYTTKGEGRGIGFALIRNTVEEYGGILEIESELGEGSSISVTFKKKEDR